MYVLGGARSSGGKRAGPTIYELNAHGEQRSAREIPRLVAAGVEITWRAGRRELITIAALEVLSGVGASDKIIANPSDSLVSGTTVRIAEAPKAIASK